MCMAGILKIIQTTQQTARAVTMEHTSRVLRQQLPIMRPASQALAGIALSCLLMHLILIVLRELPLALKVLPMRPLMGQM